MCISYTLVCIATLTWIAYSADDVSHCIDNYKNDFFYHCTGMPTNHDIQCYLYMCDLDNEYYAR